MDGGSAVRDSGVESGGSSGADGSTGDGCACQFYRRKKVQQDIRLAQEQVDKFGR